MRQDKAEKYLSLARHQASLFSKDPSTQVGALLLAPQSLQILSMGYNGFPRGINETIAERWERPTKYLYAEHAERNAIYNAARRGTPLEGAICVVTLFPCADCARALIQSGISRLVCPQPDMNHDRWGAHFEVSLKLLEEAQVQLQWVKENGQ